MEWQVEEKGWLNLIYALLLHKWAKNSEVHTVSTVFTYTRNYGALNISFAVFHVIELEPRISQVEVKHVDCEWGRGDIIFHFACFQLCVCRSNNYMHFSCFLLINSGDFWHFHVDCVWLCWSTRKKTILSNRIPPCDLHSVLPHIRSGKPFQQIIEIFRSNFNKAQAFALIALCSHPFLSCACDMLICEM